MEDMNTEKAIRIVNRLTSQPNRNKITTSAGFWGFDGEAVDEELYENRIKPKKHTSGFQLQSQ